ncbi:MAG: hypothetical protein D6730_19950 [Bacteroidetes bacterium]|nr:MAG: hypothetical protein D6730_19950 [Bacteroidota bacterium]
MISVLLLGCLSLLVFWFHASSTEQVYFFSAREDNLYENPANWSPAYPGTHIREEEKIVLRGMVYITDYKLNIAGSMDLGLGSTLYALAGDVQIGATGQLTNRGELMVNRLINEGKINNSASGKIDVMEYTALPGAYTHNGPEAAFITAGNLHNQGVFNNYNLCKVRGKLINEAVFNMLPGSRLLLRNEAGKWEVIEKELPSSIQQPTSGIMGLDD